MADKIESFNEITDSNDPDNAKYYLEACNGNLEQAINLFFGQASRNKQKSNDDPMQPSSSKNVAQVNKSKKNKNISVVELSDDDQEMDAVSNGSGLSKFNKYQEEVNIREPMAPVQGPIVEQTFRQTYGYNTRRGPSNPIFEQYHDFRQVAAEQDVLLKQKVASNLSKANNSSDEESDNKISVTNGLNARSYNHCHENNFTSRTIGSTSNAVFNTSRQTRYENSQSNTGSKGKNLQEIFRPPIELMYREDWDMTLTEARTRSVWLLVNIQMAGEFACQILNRDIWKDRTVREIIRSNFLFWQVYHDTPDGIRVCGYYNIKQFPAIFIIDPRTGEEVLQLRAQDPVCFLDQITAFLERCPTFKERDAEVRREMQGFPSSSGIQKSEQQNQASNSVYEENSKGRRSRRRNRNELSEKDKDFEKSASIQAKRMKHIVNINDEKEIITNNITTDVQINEDDYFNVTPKEWQNYVGEQTPNSSVVQLLLCLPNGEKENILLLNTTKLKTIFILLAGRRLAVRQHQLVLNFPKRIFTVDEGEKTLIEANFSAQEVIHVEKI